MPTITPFPTAHQRAVLHQLDSLADRFHLGPKQRQRMKARYLHTERQGRSTAVAVAEARREIHKPTEHHNSGPSAA